MLSIISRLTPIHIDAFTYSENYFSLYRPFDVGSLSNDKNQKGHLIPLWSDLAVNLINKDGTTFINWAFSDNTAKAHIHSKIQFDGFTSTERLQHLKIVTPWLFKENHGNKFIFFQPSWALKKLNNHITTISGITDFKYQHSTNIQMFFHFFETTGIESILIEAGTPLYQFIPISNRPVKIHCHLIADSLYNSMLIPDKFSNTYLHRKKNIEKKCPFH